jgi:glycosyltransferase involved in cell wall biosynthesis
MRAELDGPLLSPLQVGSGNAVLVRGTLDDPGEPIRRLTLRLGASEPADVEWLRPSAGRIEWWALLVVAATTPTGAAEMTLTVELASRTAEIPLGSTLIEHEAEHEPVDPPASVADLDGPMIAICMTTYEPKRERLELQLRTIREQTWRNWVCVISDESSSPEGRRLVEELSASDDRFVVRHATERRGFYGNFERSMQMAPREAELVALADQDDVWRLDKFERLVGVLTGAPDAILAYSDMRVVDADGHVVSETFWYVSENNYEDIATLAIVNTIFGVASLFRRELLELVLPLPPAFSDQHYHDHWIALCARAAGEIAYLDEPTYDYVRHADSVTMTSSSSWSPPPASRLEALRLRVTTVARRLRIASAPAVWRAVYFDRYMLIRQFAAVLMIRAGEGMSPSQRRSLALLATAERSPRALAWLLGRTLRPLLGHHETMGRERVLLGGLIWRRVKGASGSSGARARQRA